MDSMAILAQGSSAKEQHHVVPVAIWHRIRAYKLYKDTT